MNKPMDLFITILITFFAGMGAGIGTGFAGMSAAVVISPMLIVFLHVDPYMAVGIALASDVLASAVSALTYGKNKNIDIKNGLLMMLSVLVFTVFGSYLSSLVSAKAMGSTSMIMTLVLGLRFLLFPVMTTKEKMEETSPMKRHIGSLLFGALIGLVCGFVGAGGGIMMLLILTSVLGYELKTAVDTSVFIMTFTAFTGSISHFLIAGPPDWIILSLSITFTFVWAQLAAVVANIAKPKLLNRMTGIILIIIGILVIVFNYLPEAVTVTAYAV